LDTIAIIALGLVAILISCAILILAIAILLLCTIAILTVPVLLWTVAVSIGLILFPWFFFSWFFLPWFFLRGRFRLVLVLVVLALHRECGGPEKQRQGRGCYQQLHEYSLQEFAFHAASMCGPEGLQGRREGQGSGRQV